MRRPTTWQRYPAKVIQWEHKERAPKVLYKFVDPQVADAVAKGRIRIGTFRSYAELKTERADAHDATVVHDITQATFRAGDPYLAQLGMQVEGNSTVTIHEGTSIQRAPDAYCLCMALNENASRPAGHIGFKIVDPAAFMLELMKQNSVALGPKCEFGPVQYKPRRGQYDDPSIGPVNAFVKDTSFADEHEFRAIWHHPNGRPAHPSNAVSPFVTPENETIARFLHRLW